MKKSLFYGLSLVIFLFFANPLGAKISDETSSCISCHESIYPGIVNSWKSSKHAKKGIGCFECHGKNNHGHKDTFEHNGFKIHVVVTPKDCGTCHRVEEKEYRENMMSYAYDNLMKNKIYLDLEKNINFMGLSKEDLSEDKKNSILADSCLYCHGTKLKLIGWEKRETMFGDLKFPKLRGWPNQGVGRINPDGSRGSCTSCHSRHSFSIEIARKPYSCAQCHKGPDVPAYKVYSVSKHGNIYKSIGYRFNFKDVPWKVGKDFTVPTCATCHMSEIATPDGKIILKRTHKVSDRLSYRIFGNPYAHPHPIGPKTYELKNKQGLQLPISLDGTGQDSPMLIDKKTQLVRAREMNKLCNRCHSYNWTNSHFNKLDNIIFTTNRLVKKATMTMVKYWDKGIIKGIKQHKSIFDEPIEKKWTELWLFYANSIRFSAAMSGGGDYGVFANGRFYLNKNLADILTYKDKIKPKP